MDDSYAPSVGGALEVEHSLLLGLDLDNNEHLILRDIEQEAVGESNCYYADGERISLLTSIRKFAEQCDKNGRMLLMKGSCSTTLSRLGELRARELAVLLSGCTWAKVHHSMVGARDPYVGWVLAGWEAADAWLSPDIALDESQLALAAFQTVLSMAMAHGNGSSHRRIDNERREHQRKRTLLLRHLKDMKRAFPKLMVIRLDLWYREGCEQLSIGRILTDWRLLKARIGEDFHTSFLGYALKLESGVKRGPHIHALLIFNAAVVRQDVTIAKMVGERWVDVTDGLGYYFNCNDKAYVNRLKHRGVGVFTMLDDATVAGFEAVANYITKPDHLVRWMMPDVTRFFRSHLRVPRKRAAKLLESQSGDHVQVIYRHQRTGSAA